MPKRRLRTLFDEFYYYFNSIIWEKYQMDKTISAIAILKLGRLDIIVEANNLYYRIEDLDLI